MLLKTFVLAFAVVWALVALVALFPRRKSDRLESDEGTPTPLQEEGRAETGQK